jgi:hypothetical protein
VTNYESNIIQLINTSSNTDVLLGYFNDDIDVLISFLKDRDLMKYVDLNSEIVDEDNIDKFIYNRLMTDKENTLEFILDKYISDVTKEGDDYYLRLRDREEISSFFEGSGGRRNKTDSSYIVSQIFSDNDFFEPFDDTTNDIYNDVIEMLNAKNKDLLCNSINDELLDSMIPASTDLLENIAEREGTGDYVSLNVNIIHEILKDEDSTNDVLDEVLDIKSNLYSLHNNAYNSAYLDEIYKQINDELSTLFDPKIITRSEKIGDKTKYIEYLKINDFYGVISDFLAQFNDSHYSDDRLDYSSSFTDLVVKLMNESNQYDFFTIRVNDYPDDRVVTENINSLFLDYL